MHDETIPDDPARPVREHVFRLAEDSIEWCTAPLVHFDEGKSIEWTTGVLMQIADQRYLVTAAHKMLEHDEAGHTLHLLMPAPGLGTVPLVREMFWSTTNPREDMSVTRLHEKTVEALGSHYRYLRLTDLMSKHDARHGRGLYLLMGFPLARIRLEHRSFLIWLRDLFGTVRYLVCPRIPGSPRSREG